MAPNRLSTAAEIACLASQLRVADPNVDSGSFPALTTNDTISWILGIGHINEIDPRMRLRRVLKSSARLFEGGD
jgi:hypothetical protein